MMEILSIAGLILAGWSGFMILWNLSLFRRLAPAAGASVPAVSVLIPARNEERNIASCVQAVLANRGVELELLVMDDDSTDRTREIVEALALKDRRLKLLRAADLADGWVGKTYACDQLSRNASHDVLVFIDADVEIAEDAICRIASQMQRRQLELLSGFPAQVTAGPAEKLVVPMIFFLLLGYLPIWAARKFGHPAFSAGCGQLLAVNRPAYRNAGGHRVIANSMHDGIMLPRSFRKAGYRTDIFDAADVAQCRMYSGWKEVWYGFKKNATEGMATPIALPIWTLLLGIGHVFPFLALSIGLVIEPAFVGSAALWFAVGLSILQRYWLAHRFEGSSHWYWAHPVSVVLVLAIQWSAFFDKLAGRQNRWRGRKYSEVQPHSKNLL